LGGIEISSQRRFFTEIDSVFGRTLPSGAQSFTSIGRLGAEPLSGVFDLPIFNALEAGENAGRGNLGITFNTNGINGNFNGVSIANTLDTLGRFTFFGQTAFQGFELISAASDDFLTSGFTLDSISTETRELAFQTSLDITFGAIGTFFGVPGVAVGLLYTFREPLIEASQTSFENQQQQFRTQVENNQLIPLIGPRF
jgi:hypothetical protein